MPIRITLAHGVRGGMERQADTVARALAARGHAVTVVTTAHPADVRLEIDRDIETLYIPRSTWRRYQAEWWAASYAALRQRHAETPYDVILSQSAGALGYLCAAHRDLGLPTVVTLHGSALGELTTAWRGARSPRGVYRLIRALWRQPRMVRRWRLAAPAVAYWIAVSLSVARENRREIGFSAERVTVIPNGVDTDRFRPDAEARAATRVGLGLPADAPVLAVASRLEYEKGVHIALDALARLRPAHPAAHLVIAGAGRALPQLRRQASALGLRDGVTFLGLVDHAGLPDVLAAADIFVMPSQAKEAFPVSIVEALAAGLPVAASRVGGVPDAVTDGQTGRLVPPGNPQALALALDDLVRDPSRARAMGALARQVAERRFSLTATTAATEDVLRRAVEGAW